MERNKLFFGFYHPSFRLNILLFFVNIGMGTGKLKSIFSRIYKKYWDDAPIDIVYQSLKLRLYPYNNTIENKILFSCAIREKKELKMLKETLTSQSTFLDIGANIGYYALNVAKFGVKKVIAIEPNHRILPRLKDNITFNDFDDIIKVLEMALSDKEEYLNLSICHGDMGSSSAVEGRITGEEIKIKAMPLTSLLAKEAIKRVDAIKIDVEGMEDKILFPYFYSIQTGEYPKIIIIEDNSESWEKNILNWLLDNGYRIVVKTRANVILSYEPSYDE